MASAQWHFERSASGAVLVIHAPDPSGYGEIGLNLEMSEEEFRNLVRQLDRVLSFAAGSANGTFTPKPTPEQAASQLSIERYLVTARWPVIHTHMAESAPWANWVQKLPGSKDFTWLVTVFSVDSKEFLQIARSAGVTVQAVLGTQDPSMMAAVVAGDPDHKWSAPLEERATLNGHG